MIILMIVLGLVERPGRDDLRLNRLLEAALHQRLGSLRRRALRLVVIEDRGAVLVAHVAELPVLRERIDVVPENIEKLVVAHLRGVKGDLYRFGMPGAAVRHLLVGGIGGAAAGIARRGAAHALDLVEIGLHAPEAPAGEGGERTSR